MAFRFSIMRFIISCTSAEDRVRSLLENSKRMVSLWNTLVS